jgi:glycosyltransferase involved in cell wall biosynthesis
MSSKNKKIIYVTYQTFPAETANSLQSISNIKYFLKNNIDISLYFPLREKNSSDNIKVLQNKYKIEEDFFVQGVKHYLPFGRIGFLEKVSFHFSHLIWSFILVNKYFKNRSKEDIFFTRSEWLMYFLSKKESLVIYECHQTSRVRNYLINKVRDRDNIKFIFLNENLSNFYSISPKNSITLHNAVDHELFQNNSVTKTNTLIFVGNLSRFSESRNIDFLIDFYRDNPKFRKYNLNIVGGPKAEASRLSLLIKEYSLENVIKIHGRLNREDSIRAIQASKIGILINSSTNLHSFEHTSPLKYFEYIYGGLGVIAIDFPAHRVLPFNENISYFQENNSESFSRAIENSLEAKSLEFENLEKITIDARVKKIINFIN